MNGGMRWSGQIYWNRNKRLPSGLEGLISIHLHCVGSSALSSPNPEEGPGARDSVPSVQSMSELSPFSLCSHPVNLVSVLPDSAPASTALLYPGSNLEPGFCPEWLLDPHGCYGERTCEWMGEKMHVAKWEAFVKLRLHYLRLSNWPTSFPVFHWHVLGPHPKEFCFPN